MSTISDSVATALPRILVVEDGPGEREALARMLRVEGYDVAVAADVESALPYLRERVDMIVSDLRMRGQTGVELLQRWREVRPETPFAIVTAYGDVASAVAAMKLGAADFMTKPVDPGRLLELVRTCISRKAEKAQGQAVETGYGVDRLLGDSQAMSRVREHVRRAAASDSTVLVLGESGTGKELAAAAVHAHSNRSSKPFVAVNMAAVPDTLVESELFGHVKGSFTGATADRVGRFEAADGGTLFIDEIGDFPGHSQAKLLRVLESRVTQRVGSNDDLPIDVRLVAATSRNLRTRIEEGRFREDLYYRLNVITIQLPPLRERRDDIPMLVDYFLASISSMIRRTVPHVDSPLQGFLMSYDWPGNVRQLRNCLESMLVLTQGDVLTTDDLPPDVGRAARAADDGTAGDELKLDRLTKAVILQTLERLQGNRTRAAEALGISVRTLQRRLKEWSVA